MVLFTGFRNKTGVALIGLPAPRRPAVMAVVAPLMVTLLAMLILAEAPVPSPSALMARVPPLKVIALLLSGPVSRPALLPPAALELFTCKVPAFRKTPPVKLLLMVPARAVPAEPPMMVAPAPVPDLVRAVAPALSAIRELMTKLPAPNWLMIRSPAAEPVTVPPLMVEVVVAVGVTRMPPVVIEFTPAARVTV